MKIAVVGCGAVGTFYGARLCRAGRNVHFLLRSDYDTVRRHGVAVRSPQGDFEARPNCANTPEAIGLKLLPSVADEQIGRTLTMGPYKPSTVIDFEQGRPLELEALFIEPLRQAQRAGISAPRLSALCGVLTQLDLQLSSRVDRSH